MNDYSAELTVECDLNGIPVNTYVVAATVAGGYYSGYGEDVLVVYDPSLGFTTGGGWFYWPGTGDRTNFGYTMKYNKKGSKVQGSLLLIRHLADGSIYRVKSNAVDGLALGDGGAYRWATFGGKSTYLERVCRLCGRPRRARRGRRSVLDRGPGQGRAGRYPVHGPRRC
jgi:hypothetical protein